MDFRHYLNPIFYPQNIAVIGASVRPDSLGTLLWHNIESSRFSGNIFPINPKYKNIGAYRCHATLSDIKKDIDLAVVISPPGTYPKIIESCIKKGVRGIMLCGGFPKKEISEEVLEKIEEAIAEGIRVVGPQSLGITSAFCRLNASFLSELPPSGTIGLVSQSPGLSNAIVDYVSATKGGFSCVIDPGMEKDLCVADYVDFLAHDRNTGCIVLYLESFKNPRKLLSSFSKASQIKPVLVLKGGRTPIAADIVINNQGTHQDEDGVMERAFEKAGALMLESLMQLENALHSFIYRRDLLPGDVYAIVNSKGLDTLVADNFGRSQLKLADADSTIAKMLGEKFGIAYPYTNPVNVGLSMNPKTIASLVSNLLAADNCSAIIVAMASSQLQNSLALAKALQPIAEKTPKTIIPVFIGGSDSNEAITYLRKKGIPSFDNSQAAVTALRLMKAFEQFKERDKTLLESTPVVTTESFEGARKIVRKARKEKRNLLYEAETKRILASLGFETTSCMYAGSFGEAVQAAKALNYPVAMKLHVDGILSKSDFGGVILGIRNQRELKLAWQNLLERAEELLIGESDFGVEIQKTISTDNRRELRLGFRTTRQFGPILHLGIGGFYGKAVSEEYTAFVPLSMQDARNLLDKPQIKAILKPYKGLPAVDQDMLCDLIMKVSALATAVPAIHSLEIDPLLCGSDSALVLDAHASVGSGTDAPDTEFTHLIFPNTLAKAPQEIEGRFGTLQLRPAQPGDYNAFIEYLSHLSESSRHLRFHGYATNPASLAFSAVAFDPDRSFSVVALDHSEEKESIVAEATFSLMPNAVGAEFGISVSDDWQRMGLASPLMDALENEARRRNLKYLVGYVLGDNEGMRKLMLKRGYIASADEDDPHVVLFTLRFA